MSQASATTAIKGLFDWIAKGRQSESEVWTGDGGWVKVDNAADEDFENVMKGEDMSSLDRCNETGATWDSIWRRKFFENLNTYFRTKLDLSPIYLESFLAAKGWRVPYYAAEAYFEALGRRLPAQYVFPKGTRVNSGSDPTNAGLHHFGSVTANLYSRSDGALPSVSMSKGAPILYIYTTTNNTGGSSPIADPVYWDGSKVAAGVAITPNTTQYAHATDIVVGGAKVDNPKFSENSAGQKIVLVKTSVAQFKAGQCVLLQKADLSVAEVCCIASVGAMKLTMVNNLINSWKNNDLILPFWIDLGMKSGTVGGGKTVAFYGLPDRIISL